MCRRLDELVAQSWVDGQGRSSVTEATIEAIAYVKRIINSGCVEGVLHCLHACQLLASCWQLYTGEKAETAM